MPGLMDFLRNNSEALSAMGAGLLSGNNAQQQFAQGLGGFATARRAGATRNKTVAYLQQANPELADAVENGILSAADAFGIAYKKKLEAEQPGKLSFEMLDNGTYGTFNDKSGEFNTLGNAPKPVTLEKPTFQKLDDGSYGFADPNTGSFNKLGAAPKPLEGSKAPTGFRWTDSSQSALEPIPGGPAEQIAAEQAGRIGVVDSFLARVPELRKKISGGETTGWWDRAKGGNGYGSQGQVYQDLQSGVDALTRLMTGAGMNQTEAQEYASRYLPSYKDDAGTATAKFDRLVEELRSARSVVLRGRGDTSPSQNGSGQVDELLQKYGGL